MKVGLIGHPVSHSRSPELQNAAFAACGLADWTYELWDTPPNEVPMRMREMRHTASIAGANVTVPHKQAVIHYLAGMSEAARAIGAVNTITKEPSGAMIGHNTDWIGFAEDLRQHGIDLSKMNDVRALVLGAGGSARAIVYALLKNNLKVMVINRDAARAEKIADDMLRLRSRSFHPRIIGAGSARFSRMDVPSPKLIVNCTSAGMTPNEDTSPWPADAPFPADAILYDLVYKPSATKLMADAAGAGLRVIGGIGMLAEQAAAAFELWTGVSSVRGSGMMRKVIDGGRETEDEN